VYAQKLARQVVDIQELAGRSPLSTAAASLYMAACLVGERRSYKEISAHINVSDATIKQAYKRLYEHRAEVVDPTWTKPDGSLVSIDDLPSS
jgi:transcription initiation factor TFIIB